MKVGFIGTGHMGNPMARHLIAAGHDLVVSDLRPEAAANLLELGATWEDRPREVAAASGVVFTSLPGPAEVDAVALAEDGILAGAAAGTLHVDLSSNSVASVRRLALLEAQRGVTFLDAPVSGAVRGATEGTLAVMVGGERTAFEAVRPLLEAFGKNIFHLGGVGMGTIAKLTNNLLVLGSTLLLQEVLALGTKAGLDAQQLYDVWSVSSSAQQARAAPGLLRRAWDEPTFTLALSAKDIGLCLEAARELSVPMTVGSAVHQVFVRSVARGLGEKAPQATLLTIEQEAGVTVGPVTAAQGG
jgi:3-hydroxyisobutyrate dehydrogenase